MEPRTNLDSHPHRTRAARALKGADMTTEHKTAEAPLKEYYWATDQGDTWKLQCKACKRAWALHKENILPGSLLTLLDHAHSHEG